jgi:hypothetical protein
MCLLSPFTVPIGARLFASSVVTPLGYKAGNHPCANLRPIGARLLASSPAPEKVERQRDRSRNRRESC